MRWLLILVTGLALMFSACGRMGTGERIAVVNWEKALEGHSRYLELQSRKDAYNLLVDKRREQELVARTQMGSLAKLQQLKMRSKQNYFSADFMARMAEKQAAGQEEMKKLSNRLADEVDKELADEERKLNEKYRLEIFNLRLKLDTIRMMPEERSRLEARLKAVQTARDRDRMAAARECRDDSMIVSPFKIRQKEKRASPALGLTRFATQCNHYTEGENKSQRLFSPDRQRDGKLFSDSLQIGCFQPGNPVL